MTPKMVFLFWFPSENQQKGFPSKDRHTQRAALVQAMEGLCRPADNFFPDGGAGAGGGGGGRVRGVVSAARRFRKLGDPKVETEVLFGKELAFLCFAVGAKLGQDPHLSVSF